jgi:hypothetical protein
MRNQSALYLFVPMVMSVLGSCALSVPARSQVMPAGANPASSTHAPVVSPLPPAASTPSTSAGSDAAHASSAPQANAPTKVPSSSAQQTVASPGAPFSPSGVSVALNLPLLPPSSGYTSDSGIDVVGGSLSVQIMDASGPVVGALLSVYGTTLALATTDSAGKATLGPLAPGDSYTMIVRATDHMTGRLNAIHIQKNAVTEISGPMKAGGTVSGRVLSAGRPITGAVISDGLSSAMTGSDGRYVLDGIDPSAGLLSLRVAKSRFVTAVVSLTPNGAASTLPDVSLALAPPSLFISFEGVSSSNFEGLRSRLMGEGWAMTTQPPDRDGVWAIFCPQQMPDAIKLGKMTDFVANGGKLILLGEWGGFAGFSPLAANLMAHAVGLHFNSDLLRVSGSAPNQLPATTFVQAPANALGSGTAQMMNACSVFGLQPLVPLARTRETSFRVQAFVPAQTQDLALGTIFGAGRAIIVGDTSLWSDEATDGITPNLQIAGNALFADQIFNW